LPIEREIDGKYLEENARQIKAEIEKWKSEWLEFGVTVMCDSWMANSEERHQLLGLLQWHYVFLEYSQDHKFQGSKKRN